VTLADVAMAERQRNAPRLEQLRALRAERFELMARLAELPSDMVFFTQITMEAAEDEAFLDAMRRANIKGALVGVEAVTPEGLKDVFKSFNDVGEALVQRLRKFSEHGVHVLGSFIFGLPSDRPATFDATAEVADRAGLAFAQFVMLTPYPGTVDFETWEKSVSGDASSVGATAEGVPPAPGDGARRDPREDPGRVGPVLRASPHLGTLPLHADDPRPPRFRPHFQALSADVRKHGHRNRQCPREPCEPVGKAHRSSVPAPVRRASLAGTRAGG
jgi:hypothetical protein